MANPNLYNCQYYHSLQARLIRCIIMSRREYHTIIWGDQGLGEQ